MLSARYNTTIIQFEEDKKNGLKIAVVVQLLALTHIHMIHAHDPA